MNRQAYYSITGAIFALIAILHALRIFYGWDAAIGGWAAPMWLSWAALVISGYLAIAAYQLAAKRG